MERFRRLATILVVIAAMLAPVARSNAFAQADTLTCDDFTNQDAAQIVLDEDDTYAETLDEDGDGEACPDLPARDSEVSVLATHELNSKTRMAKPATPMEPKISQSVRNTPDSKVTNPSASTGTKTSRRISSLSSTRNSMRTLLWRMR